MSFLFNVKPNPPILFPSALQSGRKANAEAGFTSHVYSGRNLGNLTGIFLLSSTPEQPNLLDIPSGQFGTLTHPNVIFSDQFISINTPSLDSETYSLRVEDAFGRSSEISGALKILDNSVIAFPGLGSDEVEIIGDDEYYTLYTDVNVAFGGTEIKSFELTSAKGSICLSTLDLFGEYSDNIGSSTFKLVWTGDSPIDYGKVTVDDVTTEGGTPFCWTGDFAPLPAGSYGRYSISFVSGNYSPETGANFTLGLFKLTKEI